MFYEEQTINGVLCYRTQPDSDWIEFTAAQLTTKINELSSRYPTVEKIYQAYINTGKWVSKWQPIETAPRDGTCVLIVQADTSDVFEGYFQEGVWFISCGLCIDATHWMPLPPPPENE